VKEPTSEAKGRCQDNVIPRSVAARIKGEHKKKKGENKRELGGVGTPQKANLSAEQVDR